MERLPSESEIDESIYRDSLLDFLIWDGRGQYQSAKHLEVICGDLERIERGELKRLMIFMPPRHGKSESCTKKYPAWYLGRNPDKEVIIACYGQELASEFSRVARQTFRERSYLWNVSLDTQSSAVGRWGVAGHRGSCVATGVEGAITGRGADIAILDDVQKNDKEACSKTMQESIYSWYKTTLRTRLMPGGSIILIMTRWHENDLAGRILADAAEEWEVRSFPVYAEENDILGREPGQVLWPERYPEEEIEKLRATEGSYFFAALYQQRPQPEGGDIFKRSWFQYFAEDDEYYTLGGTKRVSKEKCMRFSTCDPAATEKETSDYFVLSTWAITPDKDLLLLDVFRERAETTKHKAILTAHMARWKPAYIGVEDKTFGLSLLQEAKKSGLPVRPLAADRDKVSRARMAAARYEIGAVFHRENAPWLTSYEDELISFPRGAHDDQVDTASYAAIQLITDKLLSIGFIQIPGQEKTNNAIFAKTQSNPILQRIMGR